MTAEYANRASALDAIAKRLTEFFASRPGSDSRFVQRVVTGTQNVWAQNIFPAMNVQWGTYPNHIGHVDTPGCFRCHDESHTTKDGKTISQDCETCHHIQ